MAKRKLRYKITVEDRKHPEMGFSHEADMYVMACHLPDAGEVMVGVGRHESPSEENDTFFDALIPGLAHTIMEQIAQEWKGPFGMPDGAAKALVGGQYAFLLIQGVVEGVGMWLNDQMGEEDEELPGENLPPVKGPVQ